MKTIANSSLESNYNIIFNYCLESNETNPIILATNLMGLKSIPIHGPIHHFIVPAAILTCYNDLYGNKEKLENQLEEAARRASIVPGAFCSTCGACVCRVRIRISN
jgi:hypothetical protein